MRFQRSSVFADVVLVDLVPHGDERGFFARTFCEREFADNGLAIAFPQHSLSFSRLKGTVRGMHYRLAPHEETKLIRCVRGALYDVLVDVRPGSPTFRRWEAYELTAANRTQLYIPAGFAHGFQTLCDDVEVSYLISAFHGADGNTGFRPDDPAVGIAWPLEMTTVSQKDREWPAFGANAGA